MSNIHNVHELNYYCNCDFINILNKNSYKMNVKHFDIIYV